MLHKSIQTPPLYGTRQRDRIALPRRETFLNAYKVGSLNMLPSKMKETSFKILNSTIWTNKKAFKSGLTPDPTCLLCNAAEAKEDLFCIFCDHY